MVLGCLLKSCIHTSFQDVSHVDVSEPPTLSFFVAVTRFRQISLMVTTAGVSSVKSVAALRGQWLLCHQGAFPDKSCCPTSSFWQVSPQPAQKYVPSPNSDQGEVGLVSRPAGQQLPARQHRRSLSMLSRRTQSHLQDSNPSVISGLTLQSLNPWTLHPCTFPTAPQLPSMIPWIPTITEQKGVIEGHSTGPRMSVNFKPKVTLNLTFGPPQNRLF